MSRFTTAVLLDAEVFSRIMVEGGSIGDKIFIVDILISIDSAEKEQSNYTTQVRSRSETAE